MTTTSNTSDPIVTVVIPVFNRRDILPRAVRSVLAQTFTQFEVVIVDDGSTEDVASSLQGLDVTNVKIIRHAAQRGAAAARNSGIAAARGRLIALLDSDDEWLPTKLEQQVAFMSDSGCDISCTSFLLLKQGEEPIAHSKPDPDVLFGCTVSPGSTLMATRSCFDRVGIFSEQLHRLEDWDWLLRARRFYQIQVLPLPLATIYASPLTADPALVSQALEAMDSGRARYGFSLAELAKFKSTMLVEKSAMYYRAGDAKRAISCGLLAFIIYPFRNKPFFKRAFATTLALLRR